MIEDELIADDLEESSSFEDALDDSEESNNTDSDQSLNIRQFWQGGKFKGFILFLIPMCNIYHFR